MKRKKKEKKKFKTKGAKRKFSLGKKECQKNKMF